MYLVGKIAKKAVCSSVFLTTWHCILLFFFLTILPTGYVLTEENSKIAEIQNPSLSPYSQCCCI